MIVTSTSSLVAIDIGGTRIKGARVHLDGTLEHVRDISTPTSGADDLVRAVCALTQELAAPGALGLGLCVPGIVDAGAGIVRYAPNLGLREVALAQAVREQVGLPVAMEHDVRGACRAEQLLGHGVGVDDLLCVVIGTGIAAGVVTGGRIVLGATGSAGELGHAPVVPDGEECACGQRGCTEVYASASGLVRRYRQAGGDPSSTAADICAALPGDHLAARVWDDGARALGRALVMATLLLDPAAIVLAGGLSGAGSALAVPVRHHLQQLLAWRAAPPVAISRLGALAGLYGAALAALDACGSMASAASWRLPA